MTELHPAWRRGALALLMLAATGGCSSMGSIGNVLGGMLGGGGGSQVAGMVQGVDTRAQQIALQTQDGQSVAVSYDNQTKVVFQNQLYAVTNLERGDQVVARIQQTQNGGYYTDSIEVTQSVSGTTTGGGGGASGNVQALQGVVRQVDRSNGLFTMDASNYVTLTVSLPYNVSRNDLSRFQNLRPGDSIRLYGVFLNNSRVELRQFY